MNRSGIWLVLALAGLMPMACSSERRPPGPGAPQARPGVAAQNPAAARGAPEAPRPDVPGPTPVPYDSTGRRDPFLPLVVVQTQRPRGSGLASVDPAELHLTGIIRSDQRYMAMVETTAGLGYLIRERDAVGENGRVRQITADSVIIEVRAKTLTPRPEVLEVELKLRRDEGGR